MADTYNVVLGGVAVALLVCVPIAYVLFHEVVVRRCTDLLRKFRQNRIETLEHRRQLRALRDQRGIPIERLAADLRRLRAAIAADAGRSAAHQIGNRLAYDRVLAQACAMFDIQHDLDTDCSGIARDIERFRVEAELERVGVVISTLGYGQAA
jgi:hypothetical protein